MNGEYFTTPMVRISASFSRVTLTLMQAWNGRPNWLHVSYVLEVFDQLLMPYLGLPANQDFPASSVGLKGGVSKTKRAKVVHKLLIRSGTMHWSQQSAMRL